ncbi:MAG: tRNA modification GTPase MnmE [Bacteroidales bacterium]
MSDTICAVSTAPGTGGIAVIRISGDKAVSICNTLFIPKHNREKDLASRPPYSLSVGTVCKGGEVIDEALAALFRAPHSFTGEDTVEITCHGSIYIRQQILQLLVDNGCRLARPGEFTQRAFLNGKMDLSQAEAVADVIASTSAGMHRLAMNQMRGGFSCELEKLRAQLLDFASLVELELDFGEEDVTFADRSRLKALAAGMEASIRRLADSFRIGNAVRNGIPVAIIGETNAGKSTLLNLLAGEERAIVSDLHGTTRDAIEETLDLEGFTFRFIDTAGIRETGDAVESMSIERTFRKLRQASVALWVIDLTSPPGHIESIAQTIVPHLEGKQTLLLFNKTDLLSPQSLAKQKRLLKDVSAERLYISAKRQTGISRLKESLIRAAALPEIQAGDVIVTNVRHYEALVRAGAALLRVRAGLEENISGDLLSQDIREALHYIGEITGHIANDEILGNIFSRFCIGK